MTRKKFSKAQIATVLRELENGAKMAGVCRKFGGSEQTVSRWKSRFAGWESMGYVGLVC